VDASQRGKRHGTSIRSEDRRCCSGRLLPVLGVGEVLPSLAGLGHVATLDLLCLDEPVEVHRVSRSLYVKLLARSSWRADERLRRQRRTVFGRPSWAGMLTGFAGFELTPPMAAIEPGGTVVACRVTGPVILALPCRYLKGIGAYVTADA
jgi:hypothetical protein